VPGAHLDTHETRIRNRADYELALQTRRQLIVRRSDPNLFISEVERINLTLRIQAWDSVIEAYVASKKNKDTQSSASAHRTAWTHD